MRPDIAPAPPRGRRTRSPAAPGVFPGSQNLAPPRGLRRPGLASGRKPKALPRERGRRFLHPPLPMPAVCLAGERLAKTRRPAPCAPGRNCESGGAAPGKRRGILRPRERQETVGFVLGMHLEIQPTPGRSPAPASSRSAGLPGDRPRPAAKSQQGASARAGRWFPTHDAAVVGR